MQEPKNPNNNALNRKAYVTPVLRTQGSISELTRIVGSNTAKPLDNTTRTKTNRSG